MGTNSLKWRSEEGSEGPSLNSTIIALWKHTRNVGKRRQWPGNRGSELVGQGIGYFTTDTKIFLYFTTSMVILVHRMQRLPSEKGIILRGDHAKGPPDHYPNPWKITDDFL